MLHLVTCWECKCSKLPVGTVDVAFSYLSDCKCAMNLLVGTVDVVFSYLLGQWMLYLVTCWDCKCSINLLVGTVDVLLSYLL